MIGDKFKIAVYMYGQLRTGLYCAPWITETFNHINNATVSIFSKCEEMYIRFIESRSVPVQIDYFLDIKDFNTYQNTKGDIVNEVFRVTDSEINQILDIYKPINYHITSYENEINFINYNSDVGNSAKNSYSTMFSSLNRCANMKKQHEISTGEKYDYCALHRYDSILGPSITELSSFFHRHGVRPMTIFTGGDLYRWHWEANRLGSNDIFTIGDSFAIDLLLADLTRIYSSGYNDFDRDYIAGPNVLINRAIDNCSLRLITDISLIPAVVRKNADLAKPIFLDGTWQYHQKFWLENHSSSTL